MMRVLTFCSVSLRTSLIEKTLSLLYRWVGCLRVVYLLSSPDAFWCCGHACLKEKAQTDPLESCLTWIPITHIP